MKLQYPGGKKTGLSQSRWLCESLGLTPAASRKGRGAGPAEKRDFGVWLVGAADQPHPKKHWGRLPNPILSSYFVKSAGKKTGL